MFNIIFANVWIRTADLWCWKQLLCQLITTTTKKIIHVIRRHRVHAVWRWTKMETLHNSNVVYFMMQTPIR